MSSCYPLGGAPTSWLRTNTLSSSRQSRQNILSSRYTSTLNSRVLNDLPRAGINTAPSATSYILCKSEFYATMSCLTWLPCCPSQKGERCLYVQRLNPNTLQKYRLEREDSGAPPLSFSASLRDKHLNLLYLCEYGRHLPAKVMCQKCSSSNVHSAFLRWILQKSFRHFLVKNSNSQPIFSL